MATDDDFSAPRRDAIAELAEPVRPRPTGEPLTAGFIALVDCAPLIIARDKGFARAEGLDLTLVRETSWANIRDRVVFGHFDAAHMLAPMTIAATLGLGHLATPTVAPFVLNYAGNAITVTTAVWQDMAAGGDPGGIDRPAVAAAALKRAVDARKAAGGRALCLAMTYPFSSHNYELRYWLAAAGIDPDHDLRLIVVPPPLMVDAMASGHVDGFCVGAPWPSVAVAAGVARIVATTAGLKPESPEKVLGVRTVWADRYPDRLDALLRALHAAAAWCEDPDNLDELAERLSRPDYVHAPAHLIRRALTRTIVTAPDGAPAHVPGYIRFAGADGNRPRVTDALWYATQMARWRQTSDLALALAAARQTFQPALYDRALGSATDSATADRVTAGAAGFALFDGIPFDPAEPERYLAALGDAALRRGR